MPAIGINRALSDPFNQVPTVSDWDTIVGDIAGMLDWHDARPQFLSLDQDGKVASWLDRSGVGKAFNQTTAAKRPTIALNEFGEHPALQFTKATPTWMQWAGTFSISGDWTKIVLFKNTTLAVGSEQQHLLSGNGAERHNLYVNSSSNVLGAIGASGTKTIQVFQPMTLNGWHLVVQSFVAATGTAKLSRDGAAPHTLTNAGTVATNTNLFLGASLADQAPFEGLIASEMLFSRDLLAAEAAADLEKIKGFYRNVYGLTLG